MRFTFSFYARFFESVNGLRTTGVFIASDRQIVFAPVTGFESESSIMDDRLSEWIVEGLSPKDILDLLVSRSDFKTSSVSKPQTVEADSMNETAVMMLNKIAKDYIEVFK